MSEADNVLMGLVTSQEPQAALDSDTEGTELLALVLRFAARGLTASARACFHAAASRAQVYF